MSVQSTNSAMAQIGAEFSFLQWVQQQASSAPENRLLQLGIGDDTAVISAGNADWLVTKDVISEGTHFILEDCSLQDVGRKALAVNLSDIAAMAGVPVSAFVGIVLPRKLKRMQVEELYDGLFSLANEWNVSIAGGDTNVWEGPLVISVTLLGTAHLAGAVTRSGAKPGDQLFVTGALGGSFASGRHLSFQPRLTAANELRERFNIHAMLDLSDGLSSDLRHLLAASNVGARLQGEAIPIHEDIDPKLPPETRLHHALTDGEDFELLFALSPDDSAALKEKPLRSVKVTCIGEFTAETTLIIDHLGNSQPLTETGWVHE